MNNKQIDLEQHFQGHPVFYFFRSNEFFISAQYLENIANEANTIWFEEMRKLDPDPSPGFRKIKIPSSAELLEAQRGQECGSVSKYLYAHSLELLVKWIIFSNSKNEKHMHHDFHRLVTENIFLLFDQENVNYDKVKIEKMCSIVREVLIWAGRYPSPTKDNMQKEYIAKKLREVVTVEVPESLQSKIGKYAYSNPIGLLETSWCIEFRQLLLSLDFTQKILPKPANIEN